MIGVVVPAHNEEALLKPCLIALAEASCHPLLDGEAVRIVVVLDACDDRTGVIAHAHGAQTLSVSARNVGIARAAGADLLLAEGERAGWPSPTPTAASRRVGSPRSSRWAPTLFAARSPWTTGASIRRACATSFAQPTWMRTATGMCMAPISASVHRPIFARAVFRPVRAAKTWGLSIG